MMLRVDPAALAATAAPLRDVSDVSRELAAARPEMAAQLSRAGSEPVRRSAESFLEAWTTGLRGVSERVDSLASTLHTAAGSYDEAEARLRGQVTGAADGGPA